MKENQNSRLTEVEDEYASQEISGESTESDFGFVFLALVK